VILAGDGADALGAENLGAGATVLELPRVSRRENGAAIEVSRDEIRVELPDDGVAFARLERAILAAALEKIGGNVVRAAQLLDLKRDAMRYRIRRLGLDSLAKVVANG
jgi:transcriptional regulator with GAF, ATPase, and Fis domain